MTRLLRLRPAQIGQGHLRPVLQGQNHTQQMQRVEVIRVGVNDGTANCFGRLVVAGGIQPRRFSQWFAQSRYLVPGCGLPARRSAIVARVVICSGFVRSSIKAGFPEATARLNAGENSSVVVTTSPWPPNASMYLQKSGLVRAVPETRQG